MEVLVPSKHLVVERSFDVCRPSSFRHSLGMDAQRECDELYKAQSEGKPLAIGEPLAVPFFCPFINNPSSPRPHPGWHTFTNSASSIEILKE